MNRKSTKSPAGDRVYQAIKAHVIANAFPSGRRIYLKPIADVLRVSTTPIREALNRLAAEDLVIKAPRKGFIAMSLSEKQLLGYYELTRLLLTKQVETLYTETRQSFPEFKPIARVLDELDRCPTSDTHAVAAYTGELFSCIASLSGNAQVVGSVNRASDHLYCIRTVECKILKDVPDELALLCELLLGRRCKDLLKAIQTYHGKRITMLPELLVCASRQAHPRKRSYEARRGEQDDLPAGDASLDLEPPAG